MNEISRTIGRIEEHMRNAETRFTKNDADHKTILDEIRTLSSFRWRLIGAAAVISVLISGILMPILLRAF